MFVLEICLHADTLKLASVFCSEVHSDFDTWV